MTDQISIKAWRVRTIWDKKKQKIEDEILFDFYAIINYKLISGKHTPKEFQPNTNMHILSWTGIIFLVGFSIYYLTTL